MFQTLDFDQIVIDTNVKRRKMAFYFISQEKGQVYRSTVSSSFVAQFNKDITNMLNNYS